MVSRKNGMLIEKIINKKNDTGDMYSHISRYQEYDAPQMPVVGKRYFVWISEYVGPNRNSDCDGHLGWNNDDERNERRISEGMPGNSNPAIKRYHGWRGTNDDISTSADGVRVCIASERTEYQKTVHYKIVFGVDEMADKA